MNYANDPTGAPPIDAPATLTKGKKPVLSTESDDGETIDKHDLDHLCWKFVAERILSGDVPDPDDADIRDAYQAGRIEELQDAVESLDWYLDVAERAQRFAEVEGVLYPSDEELAKIGLIEEDA